MRREASRECRLRPGDRAIGVGIGAKAFESLAHSPAPRETAPELWTVWRRERDSNPRCPEGHNRFRVCPVRPLRHLSAVERRSEEHTSELRHTVISYAVFCLKKKKKT